MTVPVRNPKIIWRHEARREAEILKAQERGEEIGNMGTVILIDAGTMHQLNLLGGEIWQLCDGERSLEQIIAQIAGDYAVDSAQVEEDVRGFVSDLAARGWLSHD